ncbi:MAG: Uroporphyrinogen decarboxylase [Chlamydiae bacterium]|nr:Uroporphyrinogen decarboxylase [Chlamydiota bacterium]
MLFLDAIHCQNHSRPPVWIMRQAGRYMPEYRQIRSQYNFQEMIHKPELAAEVTLLPIHAFDMDAAIIFSDILTIPESLGRPFQFKEGIGPVLENPLTSPQDLDSLTPTTSLDFVAEAIKLVKPQISVPLIGFCGAPFTVASYLIEGGSSRDLKKTKQWLLRDPASFHQLLDILTQATIKHLQLQISAGADVVQIFESWANHLGYSQLQEFCFPYINRIISQVDAPVIFFGRGTVGVLEDLIQLKPHAIGLDWACDITQIRKNVPTNIALQGNLDPQVLYAPHDTIRRECQRILSGMEGDPGFIFNLGHGILPDISPDAVKVLVETVKEFQCAHESSPF